MTWSTPKTHQSREVPIPRSLIDALVAQAAGKKPEDVLFSSPNGEPIRLANWRQRVWDPAVAAAGLTGLTPHDLRQTAASLAIGSGASVKHVQRMLGHKDAAMTLNVYASLFADDLDDVSSRLDAALLESAGPRMRPEPDEEIIELPERAARRSFDGPLEEALTRYPTTRSGQAAMSCVSLLVCQARLSS